jgi:hypothetical protein
MHRASSAARDVRIGEAARATAERYGFDDMAAKLGELYASLLRA